MAWSLKNIFLPDSTTKLLEGFERSLDTVGSIVREASVGAARTRLSQAEAAGKGASVAYPWYFQIQGNLYMADGEKGSSSGNWVLRPLGENEIWEGEYALGSLLHVNQFQWSTMITADLPARDYDRAVTATGFSYGAVNTGRANLGLRIGDSADQAEARFESGGSADAAAVSVANSGRIPAGVKPTIQLGVVGDWSGGKSAVKLGAAGKLSKLVVITYPVTMA